MAELDINQSTTPTVITDYSTDSQLTDGVSVFGETFYDNPNFSKWNGNYQKIAKIKMAINAYVTWIIGKGWTAQSNLNQVILTKIRGWGEDTFMSILWNMLVIKKVNGDAYAEIIRNDKGTLINLKPLDPSSVRIVIGKDGLIKRYEQISKTKEKKKRVIKISDMFHLCNDRTADNVHGSSVIEAVEWNLEAQEEARRMFRKKVKNSGILGVIEADIDEHTALKTLKEPIKTGVEEGTFLILPKGVVEAKDWVSNLDTQGIITWLNYLDDEMYMMIGVPKVILGGSSEKEGDKKMSYLSFQQVYSREINELRDDIWNQISIRVEFGKPASLQNQLQDNELKNTSQVGFQSNDTTAGVGE